MWAIKCIARANNLPKEAPASSAGVFTQDPPGPSTVHQNLAWVQSYIDTLSTRLSTVLRVPVGLLQPLPASKYLWDTISSDLISDVPLTARVEWA